jgi:hypothetical protein
VSLLLDIFGFLSVVLRGMILVAQSFTFGGLAFLLLLLRPLESQLSADSVKDRPALSQFPPFQRFRFRLLHDLRFRA